MANGEDAPSFGSLLRQHRLARGLTQEELAARAGLGARSVQDLERGINQPRRETLQRLIEVLGASRAERAQLEAAAAPRPRRRPTVPASTPAIVAVRGGESVARNNLPVLLTQFIGREPELAEVRQLLSTTRLLTLTGAGGCGKTRLALHVAATLGEEYPAGVWLVELVALVDPARVAPTIAETLGVREVPPAPILTVLLANLRPKRLLLVLDNCEHLIGACAGAVDTLLRSCPDLRVLATSREPLGVPGEVCWRVPSLAMPDPSDHLAARAIERFDAVRLFVERARAARPGFALTDANAEPVARICQHLDGIPLAIELAAARLNVFTVAQIADRLNDRFRLLTGGSRTAPARQRTLRATIDWSHDLLSEGERAAFRRMAVFAGSFDLEAVEGVCAEIDDPAAGPEVFTLLVQLVEKSLVIVEDRGESARYRLLETIRAYATERLEERGEAAELRRRHAAYYLALAERTDLQNWGPNVKASLDRLESEIHELRVALTWFHDHDPESGLRLAHSIACLWHFRGYPAEALAWLRAMLDRAPAPTALRARSLLAVGTLGAWCSVIPLAKSALGEGVPLLDRHNDQAGLAGALGAQGMIALREGRYHEGEALLEDGLARARDVGYSEWVLPVDMLCELGILSADRGHYVQARARFQAAADFVRASQDQIGVNMVRGHLADLSVREGRLAEARATYELRLRDGRRIGHNAAIGGSLVGLARVARLQGDLPRARQFLEEGLAFYHEHGTSWDLGTVPLKLGHLVRQEGDQRAALANYRAAIDPLEASCRHQALVNCLGNLGAQLVRLGTPDLGARLLASATALDELFQTALDRDEGEAINAALALARSSLGEAAFQQVWEQGQTMTRDQAIAFAREASDRRSVACLTEDESSRPITPTAAPPGIARKPHPAGSGAASPASSASSTSRGTVQPPA